MTRKLQTPAARARMGKRDTQMISVRSLEVGMILVTQTVKWKRDNPMPSQDAWETVPIRREMRVIDLVRVGPRHGIDMGWHVGLDPAHDDYDPVDEQLLHREAPFTEDDIWMPSDALVEVRIIS